MNELHEVIKEEMLKQLTTLIETNAGKITADFVRESMNSGKLLVKYGCLIEGEESSFVIDSKVEWERKIKQSDDYRGAMIDINQMKLDFEGE